MSRVIVITYGIVSGSLGTCKIKWIFELLRFESVFKHVHDYMGLRLTSV